MPCFPFLGNGRPAIAPPAIVPNEHAVEPDPEEVQHLQTEVPQQQQPSGLQTPSSPLPPIDVENSVTDNMNNSLEEHSLAYSLHSTMDPAMSDNLEANGSLISQGDHDHDHDDEGGENTEAPPETGHKGSGDGGDVEADGGEEEVYNDENADPLGRDEEEEEEDIEEEEEEEEDVEVDDEEEDTQDVTNSQESSNPNPPPHPHLTRKHHHLRKKLDRQSRSMRLGMRSTSPLGLTLFDMDDRDITFSRQVFSGELSGGVVEKHNQRRKMDLRRRSARQNDTQNDTYSQNDLLLRGIQPDSNPGVVTFSHLKDNGRPMSAHQVTFAGEGMGKDLEEEMKRHNLEGFAAPMLDLQPSGQHNDTSAEMSKRHFPSPNRPMSAHSRVQRVNFQQKNKPAPHIGPYEDEDLDAIYEDDHNDFVETDLDHVWFRETTPDTPITPDNPTDDAPGTPLISISESDNEGVVTPGGAEVKSFDRKGTTWTRLPNQGILHKSSSTSRPTSAQESNVSRKDDFGDVIIALRDMIKSRRRTTRKPLSTIYNHFDRRNCGQFDVKDLAEALYDLRLQSDSETAQAVMAAMAINSSNGDRVSYAEFCVFIDDPDHEQFFSLLASVMAKRRVSSFLALMSSNRETIGECLDGERVLFAAFNFRTAMTHREFAMGLMRLGLPNLSEQDILRLTRRFDVYGDGVVSVTKFVRAISGSRWWKQSSETIEHHVECNEEALRPRGENMTLDVVNSALSLGIRISSDADMLWIVYEMLDSSLPPNWDSYEVTEKDAYGEDIVGSSEKYTVYVYSVNGKLISEGLEHPLAPHFRRIVKDHYLRSMYNNSNAMPDSPMVEEVLETKVVPNAEVEMQGQGSGQFTQEKNSNENSQDYDTLKSRPTSAGRPMSATPAGRPMSATQRPASAQQHSKPRFKQRGLNRPSSAKVSQQRFHQDPPKSRTSSKLTSRPASAHARVGGHVGGAGVVKPQGSLMSSTSNVEIAGLIASSLGLEDQEPYTKLTAKKKKNKKGLTLPRSAGRSRKEEKKGKEGDRRRRIKSNNDLVIF
ncbi:hypothetical protein TrVE_jg10223 [Triparma verrucosa]|uniref:Calmodulin n=1 Tax=Triparma verrucosa TaxID=1606542 RepID=A0A9W7B499_9STRA|nr:hypothetical protein TrVE_jg10223 [Triparma verrucosa]